MHANHLAGYFGGDHFFMCIPDDEQLINLIYKTIRSYIGIHSQNEGFLPIIGIYPITEKHPDTATMCNLAVIPYLLAMQKETSYNVLRLYMFDLLFHK